ncbi:MAG: NosD domain-containing protein [Bacteroidales bacterium]|nr:NosD domain-containing protein [Bacteroidales bacterium]HOI31120.1 NosD domain-containing protein [Bacteroidales bacterium]
MKLKQLGYFILLLVAMLTWKVEGLFGQQTEIGGDLIANRTLFADTTYIIVEDLRVASGISLQIEAGTQLRFKQGKGLLIDGGYLNAVGQSELGVDSIRFVADYTNPAQSWKWKGILIQNILGDGQVIIDFVVITNAERGLDITNAAYISVSNSLIISNYWRGISLLNCREVIFENNHILDNYVGLEIIANGIFSVSHHNIIRNNVFRTETTGILVINSNGGKNYGNVIESNVLQQGVIGIWIDNSGQSGSRSNTIFNNAIINNGNGFGYGLYLAMDSTIVMNNIFWQNSTAINFRNSSNNILKYNSFYENHQGLTMPAASRNNQLVYNTFTEQENKVTLLGEADRTSLLHNNLMYNNFDTVVMNLTEQPIIATENYWGTIDESEIKQMIIDAEDNPELGEIQFLPFLAEPDTLAPLAPPYMVKKQWVNDQVRLSWKPSPEANARGYKVYFNGYKNYGFADNLEMISDTIISLPQLVFSDEIAVTSVKSTAKAMLGNLGYESPYAFAKPYPYAGSDTAICKHESVFSITEAHNPFSPSQVIWITEGDGIFTNPLQLHTNYYPGNEDLENGWVKLSLKVLTANAEYIETFRLTFTNEPFVSTGADTLIGVDSTLWLQSAVAWYYDQLQWISLGDGLFSDPSVQNPVYYPGPADYEAGSVDLILQAQSDCGNTQDTIRIYFESVFSLKGKVWDGSTPYPKAKILALRIDSNAFNLLTSVRTDELGSFVFPELYSGIYVLQAVPDTLDANLSSAYYASAAVWDKAHHIQLNARTEDVDLVFKRIQNFLPVGTNRIFGRFNLPGEQFTDSHVYCDDWYLRNDQLEYCSEGLSNVGIHLYNPGMNVLLASTRTDYKGYYYFDSLPYGSYRLHADLPGYHMITSQLINFTPESETTIAVDFSLFLKQINSTVYPPGEEVKQGKALLFPNPVTNQMAVVHDFEAIIYIGIYDLSGRLVFERRQPETEEGNKLFIDASQLIPGVYGLRIVGKYQTQVLKFVKE